MQVVELGRQTCEIADSVTIAVVKGANPKFIKDSVLVPKRIGARTVFRIMHVGHVSNSESLFDAENMSRLNGRNEAHEVAIRPRIARAGKKIRDSIAVAGRNAYHLRRH